MRRRASSRVSRVSDGASIPSGERVKRAMYISALRVCQEIFPAACCPRETVSTNARAKMSVPGYNPTLQLNHHSPGNHPLEAEQGSVQVAPLPVRLFRRRVAARVEDDEGEVAPAGRGAGDAFGLELPVVGAQLAERGPRLVAVPLPDLE